MDNIMSVSKLTEKYQLTIPRDIRNFLHVGYGDKIEFVIEDNKVIIKKPNPIDWEYLQSLQTTLNEWSSEEDDAYDHL